MTVHTMLPHVDIRIARQPLDPQSRIAGTLAQLHFAETQSVQLHLDRRPDLVEIIQMPNTPGWAHYLTYARDALLQPLGFRRKNHQPVTDNVPNFRGEVGERRGDFEVLVRDADEIVFGQSDAHQHVRLGYRLRGTPTALHIELNTAVQYRTLMGELYFWSILPLQRQIVRRDLVNLARGLLGLPPADAPAPPDADHHTHDGQR